MPSKLDGLPLELHHKQASLLYEGIEYKAFWAGKEKQRLDDWEHYLVRKLLPKTGRRIVDIGCGFGRLSDCYLDRFEQIVMLDGSMTLLRQAQDKLKDKAVYIAADANHLPFIKSSFDCVLMIRVFHHMPDTYWILSEFGRILGHSGVFLFNYSNKLSAHQTFKRLLRWDKENPFVLEPVISGKTLIQHHPAYVHQMLIKTGFSEMKYFGTGVMDKLPGGLGQFERWQPLAMTTAWMLGLMKMAPWVICKTQKIGEALNDYKCIDDLLICPSCHNVVTHIEESYICISCKISYPIDNGIADFRPVK
jgi:ubiquinone/menaquinone biosynthesis C-methylase UbiE